MSLSTRERPPTKRAGSLLSRVREGLRLPDDLIALDAGGDVPRRPGWIERIELGVSGAFFFLMFVTLLLGVFWRYVLDEPLLWTVNLGTIAFVWVTLVGAGLPNRDDAHIQFDLVYEKLPPGGQRWSRIVGNLLIVVTFTMAIPGTVDYLRFLHRDKVTGLPLTFDWAFGCVLAFFVGTVLHRGRLLLLDLLALRKGARP